MAKCFLIKKNKEYKYFGAELHGYYYSFVASHSCAVISLCSIRLKPLLSQTSLDGNIDAK